MVCGGKREKVYNISRSTSCRKKYSFTKDVYKRQVSLEDVDTVKLRMEDLGFGEMFPASHKIWEETFSLGGRQERF